MASLSELVVSLKETNTDLLEISMENMTLQETSNEMLSSIYKCVKGIEDILIEVSSDLFDFLGGQERSTEKLIQMQSIDKMDRLETQRESKKETSTTKERASASPQIEKAKDTIFDVAKKILLGGAAVLLFKNLDSVEAFVKDKLIPVVKKTFSFMKDTLFPFIVNNFEELLSGLFYASALIVGAGIASKIITAVKGLLTAVTAVKNATVFLTVNLWKAVGSIFTAGKNLAFKGFGLLVKATQAFRLFMMGTFIPGMISLFSGIIAAITPILVAAAPFIAIGAAVAALAAATVYVWYKALDTLKEKLNFSSVFDVLFYGVLILKDSFAKLGNLIIDLVNKFGTLLKAGAALIGADIDLPKLERMSTDSAEKFKQEKQAEKLAADAAEAEKQTAPVGKTDSGGIMSEGTAQGADSGIMVLSSAANTNRNSQSNSNWLTSLSSSGSNSSTQNLLINQNSPRTEQTQELNYAFATNQDSKMQSSNAPTIVAPNNSNVNNSTNVNQTVAMPMPPSNDLSDKYYASVFGAR